MSSIESIKTKSAKWPIRAVFELGNYKITESGLKSETNLTNEDEDILEYYINYSTPILHPILHPAKCNGTATPPNFNAMTNIHSY